MNDFILLPFYKKKRYPCPFFGFKKMSFLLIDKDNRGCALNSGRGCFALCLGKNPDWTDCSFNNELNRASLVDLFSRCRIAPLEFRPQDVKSWTGVPLAVWQRYVLDPKTPRP